MKSASYVYTVTSVYRRLLDEGRCANAEEREILRRAFSRGGFTDGYYTGRLASGMTGVRSEEDKRDSREADTCEFGMIRTPVSASATLRLGEPSRLTLTLESGRSVTVTGDVPAVAASSPLNEESVRDRLSKMGNTMLSLSPSDITLELDSGINLSPAAINSLRRSAVEALESDVRELPSDIDLSVHSVVGGKRADVRAGCVAPISAEFFSIDAYRDAASLSPETVSRIGTAFLPLMPYSDSCTSTGAVSLPIVILDSEIDSVREALMCAYDGGVRRALVHNLGAISLVREVGMTPIASYRLNVTNGYSVAALREAGVERIISSPELTLPKARDVGGSVITLGRMPLMITERCFIKENFGCERCGKSALIDRRGEAFPMLREWEHRNVILNSQLTYMGDKRDELARYRIGGEHMIFTVESGCEICELIDCYLEGARLPTRYGASRRIGRREVVSEPTRTIDKNTVFATRDAAKPSHRLTKTTLSSKVTAENTERRTHGQHSRKVGDKRAGAFGKKRGK
jgi:putative protease